MSGVCSGYLCARGSSEGPLFKFADRKVLSRPERVRSALLLTGVDQNKYCSHSFKIGAASANGVENCVIKMLGRWKVRSIPLLRQDTL